MKYFTGKNKETKAQKVETKDRIQSIFWAALVTAIVFLWRYID
ncbi:hypothetical protein [Nicoliella spurrieriana]|nr:hypothetical protein [Nicoliella spurrieriana]